MWCIMGEKVGEIWFLEDFELNEQILDKVKNRELGLPSWLSSKESACSQEMHVQSLGWEDSLEKEMAAHFSILAWEMPWTEEPGGL